MLTRCASATQQCAAAVPLVCAQQFRHVGMGRGWSRIVGGPSEKEALESQKEIAAEQRRREEMGPWHQQPQHQRKVQVPPEGDSDRLRVASVPKSRRDLAMEWRSGRKLRDDMERRDAEEKKKLQGFTRSWGPAPGKAWHYEYYYQGDAKKFMRIADPAKEPPAGNAMRPDIDPVDGHEKWMAIQLEVERLRDGGAAIEAEAAGDQSGTAPEDEQASHNLREKILGDQDTRNFLVREKTIEKLQRERIQREKDARQHRYDELARLRARGAHRPQTGIQSGN